MLISEARSALKRPLVFGDDEQIRAIRFLDAVAAAVAEIRESPVCEGCEGAGQFETECPCKGCDEDCLECDGSGWIVVDCEGCGEIGYFVTDWPACKNDVMKAAIEQIKTEMVRPMLISEARSALKRPLVFGDDEQIRAIRFLDAVAAAVAEIRESPVCEGCEGAMAVAGSWLAARDAARSAISSPIGRRAKTM